MQARPARSLAPTETASVMVARDEVGTGGIGRPGDEAVEFVRFCRRRRRVGWPELYDEMCAAACQRAYRGWGFAELADHGVQFTLAELPGLAALVRQLVREERAA